MKRKSGLDLIVDLLVFLVTMPIWYFLLYRILLAVHASELMWFLYWIYLPVNIFARILSTIAKHIE